MKEGELSSLYNQFGPSLEERECKARTGETQALTKKHRGSFGT